MEVAGYSDLDPRSARSIAAEVAQAVAAWRDAAAGQGLAPPEIHRMASAFEHEDRERARKA